MKEKLNCHCCVICENLECLSFVGTCKGDDGKNYCGEGAGSCYCDPPACEEYGDCCSDYKDVCGDVTYKPVGSGLVTEPNF